MFDPSILAGKSILVTGGGSGLGLAMAKAFASYGAKVTIAGRSRERLEAALPEIAAAAREGGEADFFAADVRDPEQVESARRPRRRAVRQGRWPRQQRGRQLPRPLRGPDAQRLRRGRAHRPPRLGLLRSRRRTAPAGAAGAGRHRFDRHDLCLDGHGLRAPLRLRQGGSARHDALARRRVGARRDPVERDRAGPDPDGGRVLAPDGRGRRREERPREDPARRASAGKRRSPTSRRSSSPTSARTRPATASRWTAANGSPAPASSPTTAGSRASSSRPPSTR